MISVLVDLRRARENAWDNSRHSSEALPHTGLVFGHVSRGSYSDSMASARVADLESVG